jgi:hypothetical protein
MHLIQDLFLEGFSYVPQIDMHFICTPMWTKFYSCKKWVLQFLTSHGVRTKFQQHNLIALQLHDQKWCSGEH